MSTISYKSVSSIGYNPPVGINIDDHEYSKFNKDEVELENNEIEPASDSESDPGSDCDDDATDTNSEYQATTDTDSEINSDVSEVDYKAVFFSKKKGVKTERVYTVILQEEEFLPE
jgi:hypothetical protein